MNKASLLALLFAATSAFACTPPPPGRSAHDADHDGDHDEAPDPRLDSPEIVAAASKVQVLPGTPSCQTEVLGIVDVHEPVDSVAAGLDRLRRRAALLGADYVTGVEFEHGEGGSEKTHLSGTAVRCHDLLNGRSYDVLAELEVTAPMDHEDDAFDQLKSKARASGANLILHVRFEHGEGDRTKITGTAVRAH